MITQGRGLTATGGQKENERVEALDAKPTFNVPVDDAVLVQDVDGRSDLLAVESDHVLLQAQSGHLLQGPLITVFHEDVHLLLKKSRPEISHGRR